MKPKLFIAFGLILLQITTGFAQQSCDTIMVAIDLSQTDSAGLKITVLLSTDTKKTDDYIFPKSIPGTYEFLNNRNSRSGFSQPDNDSVMVFWTEPDNFYKVRTGKDNHPLTYKVSGTVTQFTGISAEDFYFIKDSIYMLNWHHLIGYFKQNIDLPYKIVVTKNKKLWGAGSLAKTSPDENTDIFHAAGYRELIACPVLYSKPDTTSFVIDGTKFIISCSGKDKPHNSLEIKYLLSAPLTEILKHSDYKPKEYSFIYYSENSLAEPALRALEHPNSTVVYYHSALLNNKFLISSSIHELIHALFAPLRIRGEVIDRFDFVSPVSDAHLWFYEGVTEYLTIKTLLSSRVFSHEDFFNELDLSYRTHKNINFGKVSASVFRKPTSIDDFYTKGSLFAFQLDVEIMRLSGGRTNLFDIMKKLQSIYEPGKPFDSKKFIQEFSSISGVDIYGYIDRYVNTKNKIDFYNTCSRIGYSPESKQDALSWSFTPRKTYMILDFANNRMEYALKGSTINKEQKCKRITVTAINERPLDWFNFNELTDPESGNELALQAYNGKDNIVIKTKPKQVSRKRKGVLWRKNENYPSDLAECFWCK